MRRALCCAALCLGLIARAATADDDYPARPVRMIVPFAPGGASDYVARIIAPPLGDALGQQIIIENRAGAAGNIGLEAAARAPADGYTIFLGNVGTVAINASIFGKAMKVDPVTDLAPVTLVADTPDILIAHPSFPPADLRQFIAYCKAHPGKVAFASPGSGSMNRLEMEQLRVIAGGMDMVHVPYKAGAGQAVTDVLAGQVPIMFTTLSSAINHVHSGRLKAFAVTTPERIPQIGDVPTLREQGIELVASSWQGVLAPAGTPRSVIAKLFGVLSQVMSSRDVEERFGSGGVRVLKSGSPEEFGRFIATEAARWNRVAQQSGATVD
jgi:tripartite-type tricarboxylate transporter receptor subunit TctC